MKNAGMFLPISDDVSSSEIIEVVNLKETGIYDKSEFLCGKSYYPTKDSASDQRLKLRPVYRKVIEFGALPDGSAPATASKTIAHGLTINTGFTITELYGNATNPGTSYIQLPFSSPTLNENISLKMDALNVTVTTGIDMTAYTVCRIIIEFLRN